MSGAAIPLHLAAFDGDNDAVTRFLAEGADVNARTEASETPLMFAAASGHTVVVRTLLENGADVNALPAEGGSSLRRAIRSGHAGTVRLLIQHGADPQAAPPPKGVTAEEKAKLRDLMRESAEKMRKGQAAFGIERDAASEGSFGSLFARTLADDSSGKPEPPPEPEPGEYRCLLLAISSRDEETVKTLLDAGYSPNITAKKNGVPALNFAASIGAGLSIVRLLLEHGADPNGPDETTYPLLSAVMQNDVAYAKLLIDAGARTDVGTAGIGPLAFAINQGKTEMAQFLLEQGIGLDDPLVDAYARGGKNPDIAAKIAEKRGTAWLARVRSGDAEGVRAALRDGADLQARDRYDGSALRIAIKNRDIAMARVLLGAGADANEANDEGVTVLHEAAKIGDAAVVELLLQNGAIAEATNKFGWTPLMNAAMNGHNEAADRLIAGGAQLGVAEAILLKRRSVAEDLWQAGTPVNFAGASGITALHAAAFIGDVELAAQLLDRGADLAATDRAGRNALWYALRSENEALVSLLLDRGAKPAGTSAEDQTPLYIAAVHRRSAPLTRLLLERGAPFKQPVSSAKAARLSEKAADADDDTIQSAMKIIERRVQLIPSLFFLQRAMKEGDPGWGQTDRLWAVLETLLAFGVTLEEINEADTDGFTLLYNLIEFGAPLDLIETVIEKGARVNPTASAKQSPLMLAVERGRADVARVLLARGANPNGGMSSKSPLEVARDKSLSELVALLEAHGASDETRQAMVAGLGEDARFLLRTPPPEASDATAAQDEIKIPTFDFAGLRAQMTGRRASKLAERRTQLEAEIAKGAQTSP